jgi:DNA-binding transcriptional ArsR family regulator
MGEMSAPFPEIPCKIPSSYTISQGTLEEVKKVLNEDVGDTVAFLKVFSDPIRVRLLKALHRADLCVCVLVELMDCEYSKLSYHLMLLKKAGLIACRKDGNFVIYHLTEFGKKTLKSVEALLVNTPASSR